METIRINPEFNIKKLGERKTSNIDLVNYSSTSQVDRINLYFKFEEIVRKWSRDRVLIGTPVLKRRIVNSVHIFYPEDINYFSGYLTIKTELSGWNLTDDAREQLIQKVIGGTCRVLESVSPGNVVLDVLVTYCVYEDHFMQRSRSCMVPATESSIESLKRKIIRDCEEDVSCPVCWKEFSSGDEAVCMPCSHEFCGGCIEKWLRTSHYCPMCRYEMPTK